MKQNFFLSLTLLVNMGFMALPIESKAITPYREMRFQGYRRVC